MIQPAFNSVGADSARNVEILTVLAGAGVTGTNIAVGDVVSWDVAAVGEAAGYTVIKGAAVAAGNALACGIAIDACTVAGRSLRIVKSGAVQANVTASTSSSAAPLVLGATAGKLIIYASATHTTSPSMVAVGLDDAGASGLTWVYARF
jgi:hypothetical protein